MNHRVLASVFIIVVAAFLASTVSWAFALLALLVLALWL